MHPTSVFPHSPIHPSTVFAPLLLLLSLLSPIPAQDLWLPLSTPSQQNLNKLSFLNSDTGWVAGDSGTIMMTTDGGDSWTFQDSQLDHFIIDIFMLNAQRGWGLAHQYPSGTTSPYGTYLLNTSDGGNTWANVFYPEEYFYSVTFLDSLRGWMGGGFGKILGTTDGGVKWYEPVIDSSVFGGFRVRRFRFFNDSIGYAMGGHIDIAGVLWRTTNGGQRWSVQGVSPEPLLDMYFKDSLNIISVGGDFDFGSGMVKSSDGGLTWEYVYLGIFGEAQTISFRTESEAWSPLGFTGTYMYTLDGGETWIPRPFANNTPMYDLVFTDSLNGYMVGDHGTILKYDQNPMAIRNAPAVPPAGPELLANYPNPFNPETEFGIRIAEFGLVDVAIYDLMGRKVETLLSRSMAPGEYRLRWNGNDARGNPAASGVYIYRLRQGSTVLARKMMLLR